MAPQGPPFPPGTGPSALSAVQACLAVSLLTQLEALQHSNPVHYEKVRKILDGVLQQRDAQVPRWIQVNFDGRDVAYGPIVLTSHPPKRRLSFALDTTRYEATIVLTNVTGQIVPAR